MVGEQVGHKSYIGGQMQSQHIEVLADFQKHAQNVMEGKKRKDRKTELNERRTDKKRQETERDSTAAFNAHKTIGAQNPIRSSYTLTETMRPGKYP